MSHLDATIRASYLFCRQVARRSGSNFYPAFALLPKPKRRAMDAIYAFTRYTDDLTDNPQPVEVRREALARWRASLQAALSGEITPSESALEKPLSSPPPPVGRGWGERISQRDRPHPDLLPKGEGTSREGEGTLPEGGGTLPGEAFMPALIDTVERFHIPAEHLVAVVDGVAMDLDRSSYETFDDLVTYCERVASAVGLACIHVWGFRGREAFEPARKCGIALQLTNILRDLKEDAEQGRVYLPREDLRRWGYSVEDLAAGVADERFERLMGFQIDRARRFYQEGAELFGRLKPDGRRVFGMMMSVYRRLLERIASRPGDVFCRRVGLSRWEKLSIAARWALLPAGRSALR